jgi:hypothetical protein
MRHRTWARAAARLAGVALTTVTLLATAGFAGASPSPSRELTAAEVEAATGMPVGGQDCAHAKDMAARDTGQRLPAVDTCGYYLGGTTFFDASGVATVMRVTTTDSRALMPVVLPSASRAELEGVGDWAYWSTETNAGGITRVSLVAGTAGELIATEIIWNRDARDTRTTLDAVLALAQRTVAPAAGAAA